MELRMNARESLNEDLINGSYHWNSAPSTV